MPTINAKDLGLSPEEAKMMFTGLTRNQAVAKIAQLQEEKKYKMMAEKTSAIVNEMSNYGVPAEEITKSITATKDLDQGTREAVLNSYIKNLSTNKLFPVKDLEIRNLNDAEVAKNSLVSIVDNMIKSIDKEGTKIFWGKKAGERGADKTNLLLAMKNLEKTGALDKGTIDVLADLIPENEFFATEGRQKGSLEQLKNTIISKMDEFSGSYRGTSAEKDPRTKRIFEKYNTNQSGGENKDPLGLGF